ncbi:hypothetical protein ACIA8K_06975 [Catenuloplanes sp. NPDC051500]|uniref:hypothetical protein n=1 Tax=Catenuloplanes sp. NPDC051500 TaxID=3363959 RepID=UPI0037960646
MSRNIWAVAVIAAGMVALSGCGGSDAEPPAAPKAPATSAPAAPATSAAAAPKPAAEPSYSEQDRATYLAELAKIDPGLVVNEERAIRRAEETCADIAAGEITGSKLVDRVVERLSGGNATINASQADRALELMKTHICK